ncbi:extracellular solute-binding protein [Paenibacillus sp. GCM10027626]|uniref:extracellular solute-binding protein n=1 Tax=Paenibacillus sp. GCM10027626 TaxID=3273411 RepID=UPI003641B0AC
MKNKVSKTSQLLAVAMTCSLALSACSTQEKETPAKQSEGNTPANNTTAGNEKEKPSSEKVAISLVENGWVNTPTDDNDPWRKWMNEKFNVDFKLAAYPYADIESKLMVQFASNEAPDMIFVYDQNIMKKLYKQGVLLDDWTPYLDKLPTLSATFTDQSKAFATQEGKMIGLPTIPDSNNRSWKIRQDWLDKLGLDMPTNEEELLNALRKFTFDDPDGNGKNDTWGISSTGGGSNLGELSFLTYMYGPMGYFVKDNKVEHSVVNGTHKKFLELAKKIVDEKLIDPDWYTQGWEQRKPKLFSGKVGMTHYPGVLVNEIEGGTGGTGETIHWFENFQLPKATPDGGKLGPAPVAKGLLTVSKKAAEDPIKMERILQIIEETTFPNEGYWALRWGVGINGQKVIDMEGGGKFISLKGELYRQDNKGAYDWGTWISTRVDGVLESMNAEPGESDKKEARLDKETLAMEAYPNYEAVLNLDPQLVSDLDTLKNEFDIKYLLGEASDYDAFVKQWLSVGGQKLLDQAEEQFKTAGLSK